MESKSKTPSWEELTFANNFLFCKIMESEPELCKQLLEMLLHIKIDHLEKPQVEKTMLETIDSKSVRFDVYVKDSQRIFDIEIQTTNNTNLPKRARYYQSVIDMDNLTHGENYRKLKESYVIFLCLEKPFKESRPVYFFENICKGEADIKLEDKAYKVFFYAGECDKMESDEEKNFFRFLSGKSAQSSFTKAIEEKVSFIKKNHSLRSQYMTWQQTIDEEKEIARKEALAEGEVLGAMKTKVETAKNLLSMNILTPEQIAQASGLSLEEVQEIKLSENL